MEAYDGQALKHIKKKQQQQQQENMFPYCLCDATQVSGRLSSLIWLETVTLAPGVILSPEQLWWLESGTRASLSLVVS